MNRSFNKRVGLLLLVMVLLGGTLQLFAQGNPQNPLPKVTIGVEESAGADDFVPTLQIVVLITILSLAPSILIMMTSFTRIIIIFHFLRQSLSTQTVPPNQILAGLALFLTVFIMKPVLLDINDNALQPYLAKEITQQEALERAVVPVRTFMLKQTREKDLKLFVDLQGIEGLEGPEDIPMTTLIPAFIISELKTAFQIGFLLYLPMILLDLVVGSILLSMGMMMLPPAMISMPFKILLFVLVDGWHLIIESIVKGF